MFIALIQKSVNYDVSQLECKQCKRHISLVGPEEGSLVHKKGSGGLCPLTSGWHQSPVTTEANWKSHFDSFVLILVPSDNFAIMIASTPRKKEEANFYNELFYGTSLLLRTAIASDTID
jgi:hypothetical protein